MSLRNYSQRSFEIAEAFRSALSTEDADALREDVLGLGEDGWYAWVADHHAAIFSLVSESPAKIAKRRDWQDAKQRRRLALAAYRTARLGGLTLALSEELAPGGSYRDTCGQAAKAGHELQLSARWFWPFEGPAPFEAWEPPEDLDFSVSVSARIL
jgi:hypothetical protein